jgi:hypothetical protein
VEVCVGGGGGERGIFGKGERDEMRREGVDNRDVLDRSYQGEANIEE